MSHEKTMSQVIRIDEPRIRDNLGEMIRGTVEETLNAMLDAEADRLFGAKGSVHNLSHICSGDGSGLMALQLIQRPHVHVAFG